MDVLTLPAKIDMKEYQKKSFIFNALQDGWTIHKTHKGFYVFEKKQSQSFNQIFGILGGLLSLYARIFAYVGRFSMGCLDSMRRSQTELHNIDSSAE